MKISFGRAIRVESDTNFYDKTGTNIDPATKNVINTIDNKSFTTFDKENAGKIRDFLRAQIGDYTRKTGMITKRINGEIYVFTGKEAKKADELNKKARLEIEAMEEGFKDRLSYDDISQRKKIAVYTRMKHCRENILAERDRQMLEMAEDGRQGKPDTKIIFNMHECSPVLKSISYMSVYDKNGETVREFNSLSL